MDEEKDPFGLGESVKKLPAKEDDPFGLAPFVKKKDGTIASTDGSVNSQGGNSTGTPGRGAITTSVLDGLSQGLNSLRRPKNPIAPTILSSELQKKAEEEAIEQYNNKPKPSTELPASVVQQGLSGGFTKKTPIAPSVLSPELQEKAKAEAIDQYNKSPEGQLQTAVQTYNASQGEGAVESIRKQAEARPADTLETGGIPPKLAVQSLDQAVDEDDISIHDYLGKAINKFETGVGSMASSLGDLAVQGTIGLGDLAGIDIAGPGGREAALKQYREQMTPSIREGLKKEAGVDIDPEADKKLDDGFVSSALYGVAESIPAMMTPYGAGMYLQSQDAALQSINSTETGRNLDEDTKTAYSLSVGAVVGAMEHWGLQKILKGSTMFKKFSEGIALKAIREVTEKTGGKVTAELLEVAIEKETGRVANRILSGGYKAVDGFATEFLTGAGQEAATQVGEVLLDRSTGKSVFQTEEKGWQEFAKRTTIAGIQEGIGGFAMSGTLGLATRPRTAEYVTSKIAEAKSQGDIESLKSEVAEMAKNTKISPEEATNMLSTIDNLYKVKNTIPAEMAQDDKVSMINLISERNQVQQDYIEAGKKLATLDPAFAAEAKGEMDLLQIRQNAIDDQLHEVKAGDKFTFFKNGDKYFKQLGEGAPEEISEDRYAYEVTIEGKEHVDITPKSEPVAASDERVLNQQTGKWENPSPVADNVEESQAEAAPEADTVPASPIVMESPVHGKIQTQDLGTGQTELTFEDGSKKTVENNQVSDYLEIPEEAAPSEETETQTEEAIPNENIESDQTDLEQPLEAKSGTEAGDGPQNQTEETKETGILPASGMSEESEGTGVGPVADGLEGFDDSATSENAQSEPGSQGENTDVNDQAPGDGTNAGETTLQPVPDDVKLSAKEQALAELREAKAKRSAYNNSLHAFFDAEKAGGLDAEVTRAYFKVAREYIKEGMNDVAEFAKSIGEPLTDAIRTIFEKVQSAEIENTFQETLDQAESKVRDYTKSDRVPVKKEGESQADYAERYHNWRRARMERDSISRALAERALTGTQLNTAVALIAKDQSISREEFNKTMHLANNDTTGYIQAWEEHVKANPAAAVDGEKIFRDLRKKAPAKKLLISELTLLRNRYVDMREGARLATKEERGKSKEAIKADREARKQQSVDLRKSIHEILKKTLKEKNINGLEFDLADVTRIASKVNMIMTERSMKGLEQYLDNVLSVKDYERKISEAQKKLKAVRKLKGSSFITSNDVALLKQLATLNPGRVSNIDRLLEVTNHLLDTRKQKESRIADQSQSNSAAFDESLNNEAIAQYIANQKRIELTGRGDDVINKVEDILDSTNYNTVRDQVVSDPQGLGRDLTEIIDDTKISHDEKVKQINRINDTVNEFRSQVNALARAMKDGADLEESEDLEGIDYNDIKENFEKNTTEKESIDYRAIAEELQSVIDPEDTLLDENAAETLKMFKEFDLSELTADELKQFNNVLANYLENGDNLLVQKYKALDQVNKSVGGFSGLLESIGKKIESKQFKTWAGKQREKTMNLTPKLWRMAGFNQDVLVAIHQLIGLDAIGSGAARVTREFRAKIDDQLHDIFKKYPGLHKDAEASVRLALYARINQSKIDSLPAEANDTVQKRIGDIGKDIDIKTEKGGARYKTEVEVESKIFEELRQAILSQTGKDIAGDGLAEITTEDIANLEFLKEGEKEVYKLFRSVDDEYKSQHEEISRGILGKQYQGWTNHQRDSYTLLKTGKVKTNIGQGGSISASMMVDDSMDADGSSALIDRVEHPLAERKDDEGQRVINLDYFNTQKQGIKDMLHDIYTLEARFAAEEVFKRAKFKEAVNGVDNVDMLQDAVRTYALNAMERSTENTTPADRAFNQALSVVSRLAMVRQLGSITQYVLQFSSAYSRVGTDLRLSGKADFLNKAIQVVEDQNLRKVLENEVVSEERPGQKVGYNITGHKSLNDHEAVLKKNFQLLPGEAGKVLNTIAGAISAQVTGVRSDGTVREPKFTKWLSKGDVKAAEAGWIAYYAAYLVDKGVYKDFDSIDWVAEGKNKNRKAVSYAEAKTSMALNENTSWSNSKLSNNRTGIASLGKAVFLPFGSFSMNKGNVLMNSIEVIRNKGSLKEEKAEAWNQIKTAFVEELSYKLIKRVINTAIKPAAMFGIVALVKSMTGADDDEMDSMLDFIWRKVKGDGLAQSMHALLSDTVADYALGTFGSGVQDLATSGINEVSQLASGEDLFVKPKLPTARRAFSGTGMLEASGAWDIFMTMYKDIPRSTFQDTNKNGLKVDRSWFQRMIVLLDVASQVGSVAGVNDAELKRMTGDLRKAVDSDWSKKYKDEAWRDQNAGATRLKIADQQIFLSDKQSTDYENYKAQEINTIMKGVNKKEVSDEDMKEVTAQASERAKERLYQKYGEKLFKKRTGFREDMKDAGFDF